MALAVAVLLAFSVAKTQSREILDREYRQAVKTAEAKWQEGEFEAAFSLLNKGLELARKTNDGPKEIRCLMRLGKLCWPLCRPEESRPFYAEALKKTESLSLKKEQEESRGALKVLEFYAEGKAARLNGQLEKSIADFSSALDWARKIQSPEHEVKCLRQLSLTYWASEDQGRFLSLNITALEIASRLKDRREQVKCQSNIGMYFFQQKNYVEALENYSQALGLARQISSQEDESICLKNISLILMHLGFYEKSVDFLEAAKEIDRQSENSYFFSETMNNLGEAYRNKGILLFNKADLYRSLDCFNQALDLARKNRILETELRILNNIGKIHLDLERYHTALHYLLSGHEIEEKIEDWEAAINILNNMGICHLKLKDQGKARSYFEQALLLGKNSHSNLILWELLFNLGQCSEMEKDYGRAIAYYDNSLETIDRTRVQILADDFKAGFMRNKFRVYESLISLLFKLHEEKLSRSRAGDIFYTVERAKARAFMETMGEIEASPGSQVISEIPGTEPQAPAGDPARSQERPALKPEKKGRISKTVFFQPVRLERVQEQLLDEKTAVLEYFLGETQSLLFVLTKDNLSLLSLPAREEIRKSLSAYLILLSRPPHGDWDWRKPGRRLSGDLLGPALQSLPPLIERLIIVPDDILCHLPFETLALSPADQSSQEKLLISRYAISYAPSCSSLMLIKERKKTSLFPKSFLAFGNPAYPAPSAAKKARLTVAAIAQEMVEEQGYDLSPLEESEKEIRDISRHFPEEKRDIYLGKKATEDILKQSSLEDYRVIHFACHGFLDEKVPFRSGLFLSLHEAKDEDGFLQASEIAGLKLTADLVVLSACRTSRGYLERGEGIMGLTRTFFFSGASSVVSTLWKISDRATVEFMRHFYSYLAAGKDKAQALRSAKLRFLESKYSHPFFWAAFVLHGESSSGPGFR